MMSSSSAPKAPLSAYNMFFQVERSRILEGKDNSLHLFITVDEVQDIRAQHKLKGKRAHRKTHGKISFRELARTVAQRWKQLGTSTKNLLNEQAMLERQDYNERYKAWQQEQERQVSLMARHKIAAMARLQAAQPQQQEKVQQVSCGSHGHSTCATAMLETQGTGRPAHQGALGTIAPPLSSELERAIALVKQAIQCQQELLAQQGNGEKVGHLETISSSWSSSSSSSLFRDSTLSSSGCSSVRTTPTMPFEGPTEWAVPETVHMGVNQEDDIDSLICNFFLGEGQPQKPQGPDSLPLVSESPVQLFLVPCACTTSTPPCSPEGNRSNNCGLRHCLCQSLDPSIMDQLFDESSL